MGENPELIAMARRIAESVVGSPRNGLDGALFMAARDAALAAIIETTEAAAQLAAKFYEKGGCSLDSAQLVSAIVRGEHIRSGQHYGKDHPHA